MSLIEAKILAVEVEQAAVEGTRTRPEWLLLAAILLEVRRAADALERLADGEPLEFAECDPGPQETPLPPLDLEAPRKRSRKAS